MVPSTVLGARVLALAPGVLRWTLPVWISGGSYSLKTSGNVRLSAENTIDGIAVLRGRNMKGGKGGIKQTVKAERRSLGRGRRAGVW